MKPADGMRLDVSHVVNFYHCNLRCPYCISDWSNHRGTRDVKPSDIPAAREREILRAIAALPYRVHLSVSNTGEPLLNPWLLDEVARLTRREGAAVGAQTGVAALSLTTNFHADWDRVIRPFLERTEISRLVLACTLHDSQLSEAEIDRWLANCVRARGLGAFLFVVNVVLPGAVDRAVRMKARCDALGLPYLPNALLAADGSRGTRPPPQPTYTRAELAAVRGICETPHAFLNLFEARATRGVPCGAGQRYVFVDSDGEVFPCFTLKDGAIRLGNVLEGTFRPRAGSLACPAAWCGCPNDAPAQRIVEGRYDQTGDHRYLVPRPGLARERLEDGYRPTIFAMRSAFDTLRAAAAGA